MKKRGGWSTTYTPRHAQGNSWVINAVIFKARGLFLLPLPRDNKLKARTINPSNPGSRFQMDILNTWPSEIWKRYSGEPTHENILISLEKR